MNPLQRALGHVTAREESKARTLAALAARRRRRDPIRRLAPALACLLLLLGAGAWQVWRTPVSYISIDINPSLELGLNRLDRVVEVTAYNPDGAAVADRLSLKNQPYQQAVETLLSDEGLQGYLSGDNDRFYFTLVSDKAEVLQAGLRQCSGYQDSSSQCYETDAVCLEEAHQHGLSVGKYRAYLELSSYDATVTVEDCHSMTMGEIEAQIKACGGHRNQSGETGSAGHHHGGHH